MPTGSRRVVLGALVLAASAASMSAQAPAGQTAAARAQEKAAAQSAAAQARLIANLNAIGFAQLDERVAKIAAITTRADAERRQRDVREAVIDFVGGIPRPAAGPVAAKRFATVDDDGFRIRERRLRERPRLLGDGQRLCPGRQRPVSGDRRRARTRRRQGQPDAWAANFARAGFLTLAIDPMGQGERIAALQIPNRARRRSSPVASTSTATRPRCSSASTSHATGSPPASAASTT